MNMKHFQTGNIGHDVAKTRLANSLNSYDIGAIRRELLKHPTIKSLIQLDAVRISPVVGQNFTIGAKNQLLSDFLELKFDNGQTVIQAVNQIAASIVRQYTKSDKYGKMSFWKKLNTSKYTYSDRIWVGADILSIDWLRRKYKGEFTCKLSERAKIRKYNKGV